MNGSGQPGLHDSEHDSCVSWGYIVTASSEQNQRRTSLKNRHSICLPGQLRLERVNENVAGLGHSLFCPQSEAALWSGPSSAVSFLGPGGPLLLEELCQELSSWVEWLQGPPTRQPVVLPSLLQRQGQDICFSLCGCLLFFQHLNFFFEGGHT